MRDRSGRCHRSVHPRATAVAIVALTLLTLLPGSGAPTVRSPLGGAASFAVPVAGSAAHRAPIPSATPLAGNASPVPANWTALVNSTKAPPPRAGGGLVYDPTLAGYVLFGGQGASGQPLNDTWSFVDGNWTNLTPSLPVSPASRWNPAFVWDSQDGYALLFGGRNASAFSNDTWTFNGTAWSELPAAGSPPPISGGRIADDSADRYVVLSGGSTGSPTAALASNATWTFAAGRWTNRTSGVVGGPADPRVVTNAAYDAADGYELLFGGNGVTGAACAAPGYSWSYHNGTYANLSANLSSAPPSGFAARMMAYDPAYGGVVLYGGFEQSPCPLSNQTWLFRGGAWFNLTTDYGPGPLWNGQMAADTASGSVLLFSGRDAVAVVAGSWNLTPIFTLGAATSAQLGLVPFAVNLTASAVSAGPLAYAWDFGDGSVAGSGANVSHTYLTPGIYRPTVVASDGFGRARSASVAVVAVARLTTNATAYPTAGDAPLPVNFTDRLTGGTGPFAYAWKFGDGGVNSTRDASHVYLTPGRYNWSVNTTDSMGEWSVANGTVTVNPPLTIAAFNLSREIGVAPFTIYANVTADHGTGINTSTWSFGDGTPPEIGSSVVHTFSLAGTFTGHVTIVDASGRQVNETFNVTSVAPLTVGVAATPSAGAAPLEVGFAADLLGGRAPFSYAWTFGDGSGTSSSASPSFLYTTPGVYAVNVSVTDAADEVAQGHATVTIVSPLVANLTQGTFVGIAPANLSLSIHTTGGLGPFSVQWTFGDGAGVLGGLNISHVYLHPGSFPVHAEVTDGASDSYGATAVALVVAPLAVTLTANASVIEVGDTLSLTAVTSGGDGPFAASWAGLFLGCPSNVSALSVVCTGARVGTYNVTVTLRDALGEERTSTTTIVVIPSSNPGGASLDVWSTPIPYLVIAAAAVVLVLVYLSLPRGKNRRGPVSPDVVIEPPKGAPKRPPTPPA